MLNILVHNLFNIHIVTIVWGPSGHWPVVVNAARVSAPRVLVVGPVNMDYAVSAPRLPGPGETVTGGTLLIKHGGKGGNQAVGARRLGAAVMFIGCVGNDTAGAAIRARLAAEGTAASWGVSTSTGTALIVADPAGTNQIKERATRPYTEQEGLSWFLGKPRWSSSSKRGRSNTPPPAPIPDAG